MKIAAFKAIEILTFNDPNDAVLVLIAWGLI